MSRGGFELLGLMPIQLALIRVDKPSSRRDDHVNWWQKTEARRGDWVPSLRGLSSVTTPGEQAFRLLVQGACPMVTSQPK